MKRFIILGSLGLLSWILLLNIHQQSIQVVVPTKVTQIAPKTNILWDICKDKLIWRNIYPKFKMSFVKKYDYEKSKWYCFATYLKWYGYLDVLRNEKGWVSNDEKWQLFGCKSALAIYNDTTDADSVNILHPIAVHKGWAQAIAMKKWYGYHFVQMPEDFDLTKDMLSSSPTKEASWSEIMDYDVEPIISCI